MSTPAQIAANQANSRLSTGATTEAGKKIVSQNSWKHGLCAKVHLAPPGEEDALEEQVAGHLQAYTPVGLPERDLVRNIAENHFRLQRAHAIEHALFTEIMLDQSAADETWEEKTRELKHHRPSRTHSTRHRKEHRHLERHAGQSQSGILKAEAEAILLTQLAHAKGQTATRRKTSRLPNSAVASFMCARKSLADLVN
jgi:hypothetical protein